MLPSFPDLVDPKNLQRTVLVVGAGGSQFAKIPGTADLTSALKSVDSPCARVAGGESYAFADMSGSDGTSPFGARKVPAGQLIFTAAAETFAGGGFLGLKEPNFEDLLHVTEELISYSARRAWIPQYRDIRPVLEGLTEPVDRWRMLFDFIFLLSVREAFMLTIARNVSSVETELAPNPWPDLLRPFAERSRIDCVTLNYDDILDRTFDSLFGMKWTDGFRLVDDAPYATFFSELLEDRYFPPQRHRLLHLHGSILFGYDNDALEIVKFDKPIKAQETYGYQVVRKTPSHEMLHTGPIISGLRKVEKLSASPYAQYYRVFTDAVLRANVVLIVGYGGNDDHINFWLRESCDKHTRIIEVTHRKPPGQFLPFLDDDRTTLSRSVCSRLGARQDAWERSKVGGDLWTQENFAVYMGGMSEPGRIPVDELIAFSRLRG